MNIKEFIESVDSSDLLYLAWKESNLTPSQMEDAWGIIKSVLLDAAFVKELPKDATPLTDVLDRPEHVALQYQEPVGSLLKDNPFICAICGGDTSQVEYDYLSGYDHLSCVLKQSFDSKSDEGSGKIDETPSPEEKLMSALKSSQNKVKKVKTQKIVENSNKGDKTFLELLARGEYIPPKD